MEPLELKERLMNNHQDKTQREREVGAGAECSLLPWSREPFQLVSHKTNDMHIIQSLF